MLWYAEAEYIYRQKKDIVPLLLQVGYAPDGWLGILVGTRLFFDFTGEERLDTSLPRLVRELGSRGRLLAAATDMALLQPSCSLVAPNSANAGNLLLIYYCCLLLLECL